MSESLENAHQRFALDSLNQHFKFKDFTKKKENVKKKKRKKEKKSSQSNLQHCFFKSVHGLMK